MVKSSSGVEGLRSFTIVDVTKHGGCRTKFRGGLYKSRNPVGAARKAFTKFCKFKRIRGVCTLYVTVRETTKGSAKKVYTYKLNRHKLAKPLVRRPKGGKEFVIQYRSTAISKNVPDSCLKDKPVQTRGPMKSKTPGLKTPRPTPANVIRIGKRVNKAMKAMKAMEAMNNGPISSRTRSKKSQRRKSNSSNKRRNRTNKRNRSRRNMNMNAGGSKKNHRHNHNHNHK